MLERTNPEGQVWNAANGNGESTSSPYGVFEGKTIFDSLDFLAANILLLIGGLLISVFIGWFVPKQIKLDEIGVEEGLFFNFCRCMIRFVIPPVLLVSLGMGIAE